MLIHLPHIPYLWSNFWAYQTHFSICQPSKRFTWRGVGLVYCRLPRKLTVRTCRPKPRKETHLPTPVFQVRTVSFREGDEKTGWNKSAVYSASLNCLSRAMQCVASTLSCRRYPKKQAAWGYTNSIQFLQSYAESLNLMTSLGMTSFDPQTFDFMRSHALRDIFLYSFYRLSEVSPQQVCTVPLFATNLSSKDR